MLYHRRPLEPGEVVESVLVVALVAVQVVAVQLAACGAQLAWLPENSAASALD